MIQFTLQHFGIHTIVGTHVINTGTETASTKMFPLRTFDPVACHRTSALRSSADVVQILFLMRLLQHKFITTELAINKMLQNPKHRNKIKNANSFTDFSLKLSQNWQWVDWKASGPSPTMGMDDIMIQARIFNMIMQITLVFAAAW